MQAGWVFEVDDITAQQHQLKTMTEGYWMMPRARGDSSTYAGYQQRSGSLRMELLNILVAQRVW